jgi:RNA polymerase primary sigma factor
MSLLPRSQRSTDESGCAVAKDPRGPLPASEQEILVQYNLPHVDARDVLSSGINRLVRHSLRLPLLTREQECELAKQRIEADKEIALIRKTLSECKPRAGSRARSTLEAQLSQATSRRDEAVCAFMERNIRLAIKMAADFGFLRTPLDSRVASAFEGLREAGARFDPDKGAKFSTYASFWVRQRIFRDSRVEGPVIRLSQGMIRRLGKLAELEQHYLSTTRRTPSVAEIGAALHLNAKQVRVLLLAQQSVAVSIEPSSSALDGEAERDQIADPNATIPGCELVTDDTLAVLQGALKCLQPREREVLRARFGFKGQGSRETLETIGQRLGVTRERIRQLEAIALEKLRKRFRQLDVPSVDSLRRAPRAA